MRSLETPPTYATIHKSNAFSCLRRSFLLCTFFSRLTTFGNKTAPTIALRSMGAIQCSDIRPIVIREGGGEKLLH